MPAIDQTVTLYQGDSFTIFIGPIKDDDGNLIDLNGAQSVRWWMGKTAKATGADVYIKKTMGTMVVDEAGDTVGEVDLDRIETDSWQLIIRIFPADTETAPTPNTYYHEAEVVDADGKVSTVCLGPFILKPTIVRNI